MRPRERSKPRIRSRQGPTLTTSEKTAIEGWEREIWEAMVATIGNKWFKNPKPVLLFGGGGAGG